MSEFFESLVSLVRKPADYGDEKPFQAEFFSVERLSSTRTRSPPNTRPSRAKVAPNFSPDSKTTVTNSKPLTKHSSKRCAKDAPSHRRPSGSSTTITSSKSNTPGFARAQPKPTSP